MDPIVDQAEKPKDFKVKGKYVVRTPTDQQRVRLEKLMENPQKPVVIPMSKTQKDLLAAVPTFVRNVMGSSAGAGSGEFHVYRHLRRKEFARQKQIQHKSKQEELDEQFQLKVENNRNAAESKTAKKRAKRMKKKQLRKNRPQKLTGGSNSKSENDDDDDEDNEDNDDGDEDTKEGEDNQNDDEKQTEGPADKRQKLDSASTITNESDANVAPTDSAAKQAEIATVKPETTE